MSIESRYSCRIETPKTATTCPTCGMLAMTGSIGAPLLITNMDGSEREEIGEWHKRWICPNGHEWPMLDLLKMEED